MASQNHQQQHLAMLAMQDDTREDALTLIALVGPPNHAALKLLPGSPALLALQRHPQLELAYLHLIYRLPNVLERADLVHDHHRMIQERDHQVRELSSFHIDAMTAAKMISSGFLGSDMGQFLTTRAEEHKKTMDDQLAEHPSS